MHPFDTTYASDTIDTVKALNTSYCFCLKMDGKYENVSKNGLFRCLRLFFFLTLSINAANTTTSQVVPNQLQAEQTSSKQNLAKDDRAQNLALETTRSTKKPAQQTIIKTLQRLVRDLKERTTQFGVFCVLLFTLARYLENGHALNSFLASYADCFLTVLSHELGHAAANKWFTGDPINIHMGPTNTNEHDPLLTFNVDKNTVAIHSINPMVGYTQYRTHTPTTTFSGKAKNFLTTMAGPLSGFLGHVAFRALNGDRAAGITAYDAFGFAHLLYGAIPSFGEYGDGSMLWKLAGALPERVNFISKFGMGAVYGLSLYFYLHKLGVR